MKYFGRVKILSLLAVLSLFLVGCMSINTPGDLAFQSVELVDWRDRLELPGPGASPLIGMVSSRSLEASGQSLSGGPKWQRPLLKISFTSAINLSQFVIDKSANLGSDLFFCDREERSTLGYPYIHWNGVRLGQHEPDPIGTGNAPIIYYVFVDVSREPRPRDIPPFAGFDLRRHPVDLCLYVRGGNGVGWGYKSNLVVVPKDIVVEALKKFLPGPEE